MGSRVHLAGSQQTVTGEWGRLLILGITTAKRKAETMQMGAPDLTGTMERRNWTPWGASSETGSLESFSTDQPDCPWSPQTAGQQARQLQVSYYTLSLVFITAFLTNFSNHTPDTGPDVHSTYTQCAHPCLNMSDAFNTLTA